MREPGIERYSQPILTGQVKGERSGARSPLARAARRPARGNRGAPAAPLPR